MTEVLFDFITCITFLLTATADHKFPAVSMLTTCAYFLYIDSYGGGMDSGFDVPLHLKGKLLHSLSRFV